jgi:hypothetical protein
MSMANQYYLALVVAAFGSFAGLIALLMWSDYRCDMRMRRSSKSAAAKPLPVQHTLATERGLAA